MLCSVGLAILIPVEERKVHDPQEVVTLALDTKGICHMVTHTAQDLVCVESVCHCEHHEITRLDVHFLTQVYHLLIGEELDDRARD